MAITVEVHGAKELIADLNSLPVDMQNYVMLRLSTAAKQGLQKGAARHTNTGNLWASIYNRKITGGREVGHGPRRAPYAKFVLFGTRPHKIVPKTKKALRWAGPNGFIFSKIVNHPGYIGDDYMETAKDDALGQLGAFVSKALKDNL
jgi:hypothetical protein